MTNDERLRTKRDLALRIQSWPAAELRRIDSSCFRHSSFVIRIFIISAFAEHPGLLAEVGATIVLLIDEHVCDPHLHRQFVSPFRRRFPQLAHCFTESCL